MHCCPLCLGESVLPFHQDKRRRYFRCQTCALIFVDPEQRLDPTAELAVYEQHENDPNDLGYRQFLRRLLDPLIERVGAPPLSGLDFGSGPGPTLSLMLSELGYTTAIYDPYFAPNTDVLAEPFDFVTCTEVLEHFYCPSEDWPRLLQCVKPGGWLGIMTKLALDEDRFSRWHYKNDPTHVSFFSRDTFEYLAKRDRLQLEFVGNDVILLRKPQ